METRGLLIAGKSVVTRKTFASLNPATGEAIGYASLASAEDVSAAVASAREALPAWRATPIKERAAIVSSAADAMIAGAGEPMSLTPSPLKKLIVEEMGKSIHEADIEVFETADMTRYFAETATQVLASKTLQLNTELWPTKRSIIEYEPVGVVGIIKPWNYPLEIPMWALAPALMAGNTVVFKPSEWTPLVGVMIGDIFTRAGLPAGVLNVVTGNGQTGAQLVTSDVDMISFTGSVAVGKRIGAECGQRVRRASLELGGKDALIVDEDVDVELAANGAMWGAFTVTGQVCASAERIFVHRAIADEFIQRVVEKTKELRLGNGLDPSVSIGPLVSQAQRDKVERHVQDAVKRGAYVLIGGRRPNAEGLRHGFFYEPTVLTNVTPEMQIMHEETFGPVMPIMIVDSLAQAITLANATRYGLGASVWTRDIGKGEDIARRLEAGMVWINDVNVALPQAPWGGVKESGTGTDLSEAGILEYAHTKHISTETGSTQTRDWWFPYTA